MFQAEPVLNPGLPTTPECYMKGGNRAPIIEGLALPETPIYNIKTGEVRYVPTSDALEITSPSIKVEKGIKCRDDHGNLIFNPPKWTNDPEACEVKPKVSHQLTQHQLQLIAQERNQRLVGNNQDIHGRLPGDKPPPTPQAELHTEIMNLEDEELRTLCGKLDIKGVKASKRRKLIDQLMQYEDKGKMLEEAKLILLSDDGNDGGDEKPPGLSVTQT